MKNKIEIVENKYGFFEVKEKPNKEYLVNYYSQKYYQNNKGNYQKKYTLEEKKYIENNIALKYHAIKKFTILQNNFSVLDIGCGEGWVLNYFSNFTSNLIGIDFSTDGIRNHNEHCLKFFIEGDIDDNISKLIKQKRKFDIIWLDNILEHVIYPDMLLLNLYELSTKSTVLMIEVPNDFSIIQKIAYQNKFIDNQFWIVFPDHLSYFNKIGLVNLARLCNWKQELIISDFPIDFNLMNNSSNYIKDKSKGKDAHLQRVLLDTIIYENNNIDSILDFYASLANLGLGRQIIGFFKPF